MLSPLQQKEQKLSHKPIKYHITKYPIIKAKKVKKSCNLRS